jgi:hypothetical protein
MRYVRRWGDRRKRTDDDVGSELGLALLSDEELLAWGESLRSPPIASPSSPARPRRREPLRAAPAHEAVAPDTPAPDAVAPDTVAPAPTPRRRIRGRPLIAGPEAAPA